MFLFIYLIGHPEAGVRITDPMVALVNEERSKENVSMLSQNYSLNSSAKMKACDLEKRDYWSHVDPDGNSSWYLFLESGYNYLYAGENLARDCEDSRCIELLMESPEHKKNILDTRFKEVGIGRCGIYMVQHFGAKSNE